jgi:hypothetical protein
MTTQEVTAWTTAKKMIAKGLRPPVVHAATGLCRNRLRNLYRARHGKSALQGRIAEHANNRLKSRQQVIEGLAFFQVYHRLGGDRIFQAELDPKLFLKAHDEYECYSPHCLDAQTAWAIAQDLREGMLKPRRCRDCGRMYLYDPRSDLMGGCPLCSG